MTTLLNKVIVNIKHALKGKKKYVFIEYNKQIINILKAIKKQKLIQYYYICPFANKKCLKIIFEQNNKNQNIIKDVFIIPKKKLFYINKFSPLYSKITEILFVSTTNGIFTETELKHKNIGGKAFLYIKI